ncbi:MAG: alpha/beta hydrolase [Rhodocyclaceae bacterium]|nr:alpha/beta hydrolase [Rhodocyclaceae bacterium]
MPPRRRFALISAAAAALAAAGIPGCGWLPREPAVPMPVRRFAAACGPRTDTLLVLLPGRGMTLGELEREGFVDAVRAQRLAVDVWLADAHLGYFKARTVVDRLHDDVVAPALAQGYRQVWLAGISLGGFGALLYAEEHPADLAGTLLLAPYLGEPDATAEIAAAGGLRRWTAPSGELPDTAFDRRLWRALQARLRPGRTATSPVFLGYGLQDRLAASHAVLAGALPPERVFTAPGGHDWDPWRGLWARLLAAAPLPRCAG